MRFDIPEEIFVTSVHKDVFTEPLHIHLNK